MKMVKLPLVIVIALVAALVGGVVTYLAVSTTDPEMRALLERQVELAEQETAERQRARAAAESWSQPTGVQPGAGQDFRPEW